MEEEKIKLLEQKNVHLWFYGSPLILCSTVLKLNTESGRLYASAKFMNVQPENIKEISVQIICYNVIRNIIDIIPEYTYTGFNVERNSEFGFNIKIPISNLDTRNIEFILKSATTVNDDIWYNTDNSKFKISLEQNDIFSAQGNLNKQFYKLCSDNNIDSTQLIFQPVFDEYHWMCACGCLNWNDESKCSQCGISKDWLYNNASVESLKKQEEFLKARQEKEKLDIMKQIQYEEEKQKEEFIKRKQQYSKQLKNQKDRRTTKKLICILCVLIAVFVLGFSFVNYVLPYIKYSQARNSLNTKMYDLAITQFSDIGNYLDSKELLNKAKYGKASELYLSGRKSEAADMFINISEYMDSKQKYYEIKYEIANDYYQEKDYINAAETYKTIPDYMDSKQKIKDSYENLYNDAVKMLEKNQTNIAYDAFLYLGDYSDSSEMLKECIYLKAKKLYNKMEYRTSLETYNQIADYKDVPQILERLKNLSNIISAAEKDSPAMWSCGSQKCGVCNSPDSATYLFVFGTNGTYTFELSCPNHKSAPLHKTGYYKIEGNKIYDLEHTNNGKIIWTEMMQIISTQQLESEINEKNAVLTVTSPFKEKKQLLLYGNIISNNNIAF